MNNEQSLQWDNDPFALKRTAQDEKNSDLMRFEFLKSRNATVDGPYLKNSTDDFKKAYAKWLAESSK